MWFLAPIKIVNLIVPKNFEMEDLFRNAFNLYIFRSIEI